MKKYHLLFYLILLNLTITANNRTEALLSILKSNKPDYIFVVAHRGDWRHAPENSIAAIKSAISIGADMVEIDIQKTKDGDFVLMHDNSIDRTTNGKGYVSNYTIKELIKLPNRGLCRVFAKFQNAWCFRHILNPLSESENRHVRRLPLPCVVCPAASLGPAVGYCFRFPALLGKGFGPRLSRS